MQENGMRKKYSVLTILVAFAIVLNLFFLSDLITRPSTQNCLNMSYLDKPTSKVIANVIPLNFELNSSILSNDAYPTNYLRNSDKLTITKVEKNLTEGSFLVYISNVDNSLITVTDIFINQCTAKLEKDLTIPEKSTIVLMLTLPDGILFASTYEIKVLSSEGQSYVFYEMVC